MKATQLLRAQHTEAKKLFEVVTSHKGDRKAAAKEVSQKLLAHMIIEQVQFYPAAAELVEEDIILEAFEEHAVARYEIRRLLEALDDPRFESRGTTLKELIEHHVKEEEEELFPKVERRMDADQQEELGASMETLFESLLKEDIATLMTRSRRSGEDGSRHAAA